MPMNTKEQLRKAFEEAKKEDKRANRYNSADPTYSSRYYEELEENRRLQDSGDPLKRKLQARVPSLDRIRYVAENGVDRSDLGLYTKNRDEFNRRVGATVTRGLTKGAKKK